MLQGDKKEKNPAAQPEQHGNFLAVNIILQQILCQCWRERYEKGWDQRENNLSCVTVNKKRHQNEGGGHSAQQDKRKKAEIACREFVIRPSFFSHASAVRKRRNSIRQTDIQGERGSETAMIQIIRN
uniref:hypothetical protein n=1 Tax=Candidatus Electronema sp. TaxID=2698783 RepID=UPI004056FEBA